MKKTKLIAIFLIIFASSQTSADAICRDGWKSKSEGSGTCSWHKGVSEWHYDGSFEYVNNTYNYSHRHGDAYLPAVNSNRLQGFNAALQRQAADRQEANENLANALGQALFSLTGGDYGKRSKASITSEVQQSIAEAIQSGDDNKVLDAMWRGAIQLQFINPDSSKQLMDMWIQFQSR